MTILKIRGLDFASYEQCADLLEKLPGSLKVKKRLQEWLEKHIAIKQELTKLPLLVSSDIIESLFGHFKFILSRGTRAEMNRSVLFIPALCGILDNAAIAHALKATRERDVAKWTKENIIQTLAQQRRAFSKKYDVENLVKTVPT